MAQAGDWTVKGPIAAAPAQIRIVEETCRREATRSTQELHQVDIRVAQIIRNHGPEDLWRIMASFAAKSWKHFFSRLTLELGEIVLTSSDASWALLFLEYIAMNVIVFLCSICEIAVLLRFSVSWSVFCNSE